MPSRPVITVTMITVLTVPFGLTAHAQSSESDPVRRAMERVEAVANERALAADRAMAASKLIDESAEARRRGNRQRALEVLEQAEKAVASDGSFERGALIDELLRLVADERAALGPGDPQTPVRQIP